MDTVISKAPTHFVRTRKGILALLADQNNSKLSVKEFLSSRGIKENTFYYWRKKYGEKRNCVVAETKPGFAVLDVKPTPRLETEKLFAEVGPIRIYQPVAAAYLKVLVG